MHRRSVTTLKPGMVIGQTVYTTGGKVLLAEGTTLTPTYIRSLVERSIMVVHIRGTHDEQPSVEPAAAMVQEARMATTDAIARLTRIIAWGMYPRAEDAFDLVSRRQRARALAQMRLAEEDDPAESSLDALYQDIATVIDQVLAPSVVEILDLLKCHSPLTFQHSLDATIVSILIARHIGLAPPQIRCLALGALLHDIGKLRIDRSILEKREKLTSAELEQVRQHPGIGYAMVHAMPIASPLPAAVVAQHHEHQDGTGYPDGLIGTNTVYRTREQRLHPGRMTLLAEIMAVADVYSALVSDRPHRPAFSPTEVVLMLKYLSGSHLNRELVEAMLEVRPAFPVGRWVQVVDGRYAGWQGVVVHISVASPTRPIVRLLVDGAGNLIANGVEIDLQADPNIQLAPLPEDLAA